MRFGKTKTATLTSVTNHRTIKIPSTLAAERLLATARSNPIDARLTTTLLLVPAISRLT